MDITKELVDEAISLFNFKTFTGAFEYMPIGVDIALSVMSKKHYEEDCTHYSFNKQTFREKLKSLFDENNFNEDGVNSIIEDIEEYINK